MASYAQRAVGTDALDLDATYSRTQLSQATMTTMARFGMIQTIMSMNTPMLIATTVITNPIPTNSILGLESEN